MKNIVRIFDIWFFYFSNSKNLEPTEHASTSSTTRLHVDNLPIDQDTGTYYYRYQPHWCHYHWYSFLHKLHWFLNWYARIFCMNLGMIWLHVCIQKCSSIRSPNSSSWYYVTMMRYLNLHLKWINSGFFVSWRPKLAFT